MRSLVVDASPAQCLMLAGLMRSAGYAEAVVAHSP